MTDLTDKWKKGELPSGYYYVKNEFGNIFPSDYSEDYDYISDIVIKGFFTEVSEIKEVIAPIPSYEKYLALQSDSLAKNEGEEIVAELKAKVKKLKKDYKDLEYKFRGYKDFKETAYDLDTSRLEEENTKLKELLKKARKLIEQIDWCESFYAYNDGLDEEIDKVLGEDK